MILHKVTALNKVLKTKILTKLSTNDGTAKNRQWTDITESNDTIQSINYIYQ